MTRVDKPAALEALAIFRGKLNLSDDDCMMCALAEGLGGLTPIYETSDAVVVLDRFGARRGHLMVIAKRHVEDISDLGVERYLRFQRLAFDATQAVEKALSPRRVFLASLGAPQAVPMSFPHFHIHVIPLYEDDERTRPARVFSWQDGVVIYEDSQAEQLTAELRRAWPSDRSGIWGIPQRAS
jgi:diadenosine tetraphosphate (Ap4A) HIT family hydrolase